MNKNNVIIRLEEEKDYKTTENLIRESFWNVYRPGCLEHFVMHKLRECDETVKNLCFVMERDGEIIGQNVFVRANIKADNGDTVPVLTMGPICIAPPFKRQGWGKYLLDNTLAEAIKCGYGAVLFEGNINFYSKCGFTYAADFGIRYHGLPEGEDASFFLCRELKQGYLDGVTGEYSTPDVYLVDENEADEYDRAFPKKEKLRLPGQIF